MKVLFVDDDQKTINGIKNTYKNLMQLTCASTLADAKYLIEKEKFDMLVVNWNLPDSKGINTISLLIDYNIPIIVLATNLTLELIREGANLGVAEFIVKYNLENINLFNELEFILVKSKKIINKAKIRFENIESVKKYICCADALAKI